MARTKAEREAKLAEERAASEAWHRQYTRSKIPATVLSYGGKEIRYHGDQILLHDIFDAVRLIEQSPEAWLNLPETKDLIRQIALELERPIVCTNKRLDPDERVRESLVFPWDETEEGWSLQRELPYSIIPRGVWAHWHIAMAYAKDQRREVYQWFIHIVQPLMQPDLLKEAERDDAHLEEIGYMMRALHDRFDNVDRHFAELMFIVSNLHSTRAGEGRKEFSELSRKIMREVIEDPELYDGKCPCCNEQRVLDERGNLTPDAGEDGAPEYDHIYHRSWNLPEYGWLICKPCHRAITAGGILRRFARYREIRIWQDRVFRRKRTRGIR